MSNHCDTERTTRFKAAPTWGMVIGLAALFAVISYAAPYASLPRDLDRTQKQLDELTTAVQTMQKTYEDRSVAMEKMVANIDGKLAFLLRDSNLRNNRTTP